jgi:protein involved in polysaccharide export with SLBB domain
MLRICGIREILLLILISSVATILYAQASFQGDNSGKAQSPNEQDCSDPMSQGTQECPGQTQQETMPLTAPQTSASSQIPNRSYSDIESLSQRPSQQNQKQQGLLPPEPLTEFQKFVASTSGQILPIYGASLFSRVPSTFAPLDMTPVPPDYVIGPGDELRIRAWGQVSFQTNVRVDRSGEVFLPQVGPVHVAGMSFSALSEHLRGAVGRVYRNFELTVDVGQIRAIQVYVSGEARRPGVYTVSSLSTLVDALFASGGPAVQGSMRHIQLRRGSAVVADFDLYDLLVRGDKSKDVKLQPGDVIFIPPVPRRRLPGVCGIQLSMNCGQMSSWPSFSPTPETLIL